MSERRDAKRLLEPLELTEYERTALTELFALGRTTAPDLAEATGIPKNRVYSVLDGLGDRGFVKVIPGRPKAYQPRSPEEILDRAVENRRQAFEQARHEIDDVRPAFLDRFQSLFEGANEDITPTEELFYAVDVGEPSERETRSLYHDAETAVYVITKSFEYFESVEPALADALERGVAVEMLFVNPALLSEENREVQADIVAEIRASYPGVSVRFSEQSLPWRGTFIDPSMEYESGRAVLLVEEKDIPLSMRQAAVTENESFVAGLKRYFDLIWEYETAEREVAEDL